MWRATLAAAVLLVLAFVVRNGQIIRWVQLAVPNSTA